MLFICPAYARCTSAAGPDAVELPPAGACAITMDSWPAEACPNIIPEIANNAAAPIKATRRIALSLNLFTSTSPPAYPPPAPATSIFPAIYLEFRRVKKGKRRNSDQRDKNRYKTTLTGCRCEPED